jgi:hypothetical protein
LEDELNKRVVNAASVAPSTVEDIGKGKVKVPVARKVSRTPSKTGRSSKVTHTRIDKRVWATAMKIAKGNRHLLEVRDHETVVVHNRQDWRGYNS